VFAGGFLLLLIGGGAVAFFAFRSNGQGSGINPGGGLLSPSGFGVNPLATKANFEKLNEVMTLDEVQAILGTGKAAGEEDMAVAFGDGWARDDPKGPPAKQWMGNGRSAGVTSWYQWRNGAFSIFVGFAKGKRSGKDKALLSFWVEALNSGVQGFGVHGFRSDVGFMALGEPDQISDARSAEERKLNDAKWKKGNPRQLLVGRWQDVLACGYEFAADGRVKSFGLEEYASTYRFVDDDHIEISVPAMPLRPAHMAKYRVLVTQTELVLVREEGRKVFPLEFKRVR
jgi:hypothetical protein